MTEDENVRLINQMVQIRDFPNRDQASAVFSSSLVDRCPGGW